MNPHNKAEAFFRQNYYVHFINLCVTRQVKGEPVSLRRRIRFYRMVLKIHLKVGLYMSKTIIIKQLERL